MLRLLHIAFFVFFVTSIVSQDVTKNVDSFKIKTGGSFIENKGQWDKKVSFLMRKQNNETWLLDNGNLQFNFFKLIQKPKVDQLSFGKNVDDIDSIKGHRIILNWINGNKNLSFKKNKKQTTYFNYFIGNSSEKHATEVGLYEELVGENLYNGIDIRYYFSESNLRYDLIVHPNIDANQIKIKINGVGISKGNDGSIIMHTSLGDIKMQDLYVYEKETKKQVSCKWHIDQNNELSLLLGDYNNSNTLIIDPLIYSTYIGGDAYDVSRDIVVNSSGEAYITGISKSPDFDLTVGAYQSIFKGIWDCFVSKINATGSALVYSTFLGGSSSDQSYDIILDNSGNSYITGYTGSSNYCITPGVYQPFLTATNDFDAFVSKLSSNGTSLIYSTYIGGMNSDQGNGIVIDKQNNAYIVGSTAALNFDVTPGAYKTVHSGGIYDVFVTKLNATGSALIYSTLLGGTLDDFGMSIDIDSLNNAYITGYTYSQDYDITAGAYQILSINSDVSSNDMFVTKINANGTNLVYSTYIGGSEGDGGLGIKLDSIGNAYIAGQSSSINFPVTSGAIQSNQAGFGSYPDCVVVKLNPNGNALLYSTYYGGTSQDIAMDIVLDRNNDILITGYTSSANFSTTGDAFQPSMANVTSSEVFLLKIDNAGSNVMYSTYLGGTLWDEAHGIAIDTLNNIYVTGMTESPNFPVTTNAYQFYLQGTNYDAFVTKLGICPVINFSISSSNITCYGNDDGTATINLSGSATGYSFNWLPISASGASISGLSPGTYSAIVTYTTGCSTTKTVSITQPSQVLASISGSSVICSGHSTTLIATGGDNYQWNTGEVSNDIAIQPLTTSNYSVIVSSGVCSDTAFFTVNVSPTPTANIAGIDSICDGQSTLLSVSGATNVTWSNGFNTTTISISPTVTTIYSVSVSNGVCADTASTTITVVQNPVAVISGNDSICNGQTTILTANGGNNYNWNTGANSNSITVNPISSTNYSVIVSNSSCKDTALFNLQVFPIPVANISGEDSICFGESTVLTAEGIGNYTWSNFGVSFNNIIVTPAVNTSYTLIVNNAVCSDTAQKTIIVNPLPNAQITGTNTVCNGQSVILTANGGTMYSWSNGDTNSSISISPSATTNYSVLVSNDFGCHNAAYITVTVMPVPMVSISGDTVICEDDVTVLTANGIGSFLWSTGESTTSITVNPYVNTVYLVTASNSCGNAKDSVLVIVNSLPIVSVSNDTTILVDNSISLFASGGDNYLWFPSNLSCNTCSVINVAPNSTTVYTVTASTTEGCSVTKQIRVAVESDFEIFIPDIFSPNGDGQNDVLYVRGIGIEDIIFRIYDRWGEKVFESNNVLNGWDGTYKGSLLNNAVFVYDLKANLSNGKTILKHGDVTLIK